MQQLNNMTPKTEFDRIWALFQETREQIKETDRILSEKFQETREQIKM